MLPKFAYPYSRKIISLLIYRIFLGIYRLLLGPTAWTSFMTDSAHPFAAVCTYPSRHSPTRANLPGQDIAVTFSYDMKPWTTENWLRMKAAWPIAQFLYGSFFIEIHIIGGAFVFLCIRATYVPIWGQMPSIFLPSHHWEYEPPQAPWAFFFGHSSRATCLTHTRMEGLISVWISFLRRIQIMNLNSKGLWYVRIRLRLRRASDIFRGFNHQIKLGDSESGFLSPYFSGRWHASSTPTAPKYRHEGPNSSSSISQMLKTS